MLLCYILVFDTPLTIINEHIPQNRTLPFIPLESDLISPRAEKTNKQKTDRSTPDGLRSIAYPLIYTGGNSGQLRRYLNF